MLQTRLEPRVKPSDPVFDMIVDAINSDIPIVYSKINHGFWERLVAIENAGYCIDEQDPVIRKTMDRLEVFRRPTPHMFEGGFVRELLDVLTNIPLNNPDYIFAASLLAWPRRLEIAGLGQDETTSQAMIDRVIPAGALHRMADGMEFKRAMINGTYVKFANVLKTRKTLLLGNVNLSRYLEFLGAENGRFLEIHPTDARGYRREILQDIFDIIDADPEIKVILLQAGGSLSAWLAYHINKLKPQVSLIDIGLGSLICKPETILKTAFGRVYRDQLVACIDAINPSWINDNCEGLTSDESFTGRSNKTSGLLMKSGVAIKNDSFDSVTRYSKKIPFALEKPVDDTRIKQIMDGTGMTSDMIILVLKQMMNLPKTDEIVLCRSRNKAYELASKIMELEQEGEGPWVVSPLFEAMPSLHTRSIDCNVSGLICHDTLRAQDLRAHTRVVFSNLFGGAIPAWSRVRNLCTKIGFSLIIDNRNGLLDRPKTERPISEIEIVSAAALQPWGIEECSILILSKQRAQLARSKVRIEEPLSQNQYAEWIDHLERYPQWSFFYFRQEQRLRQIISRHVQSFTEYLPEFPSKSPLGSLQYLCAKPVIENAMENEVFEIRRALPLVSTKFKNASAISDRLISLPSNPFMRNVSKEDIIKSLKALI